MENDLKKNNNYNENTTADFFYRSLPSPLAARGQAGVESQLLGLFGLGSPGGLESRDWGWGFGTQRFEGFLAYRFGIESRGMIRWFGARMLQLQSASASQT